MAKAIPSLRALSAATLIVAAMMVSLSSVDDSRRLLGQFDGTGGGGTLDCYECAGAGNDCNEVEVQTDEFNCEDAGNYYMSLSDCQDNTACEDQSNQSNDCWECVDGSGGKVCAPQSVNGSCSDSNMYNSESDCDDVCVNCYVCSGPSGVCDTAGTSGWPPGSCVSNGGFLSVAACEAATECGDGGGNNTGGGPGSGPGPGGGPGNSNECPEFSWSVRHHQTHALHQMPILRLL